MKCRKHSHQLKLQFNVYKCILFKPSRDPNIQSKKKRCNLHMRCAFIYQLIHCDVARYANKICNRLKPTAAFIFFSLPSSVSSSSLQAKNATQATKYYRTKHPYECISVCSWCGVVSQMKGNEMKAMSTLLFD